MSKKFKAYADVQTVDRYMYVGRTIYSAGLMHNQVFKGGRPAIIETLKEKYPLIGELFVPLADVDKAQADVLKKGTALFIANQQFIHGGEE